MGRGFPLPFHFYYELIIFDEKTQIYVICSPWNNDTYNNHSLAIYFYGALQSHTDLYHILRNFLHF